MKKYGYAGSDQFRPLSPWAYVGYSILFFIPIVGLIFLVVFTFSSRNINRRSFARSYWCSLILVVILIAVAAINTGLNLDSIISLGNEKIDKAKTFVLDIIHLDDSSSEEKVWESSPIKATTEFTEAMDSNEAFFDKYVEFMKKYNNSDSTASMLLDMTDYLNQYADTMQKLDDIDEKKLSATEYAYYLAVMARINEKLADVDYE